MKNIYQFASWIWVATGIVWLISALASKPTARSEPVWSRVMHLAIMTAAFFLLFYPKLPIGPLAWRFVPDSPVIAWAGLALTFAGCLFAVWARLLLGGNWSASVTVKQNHTLIRKGPYTIVRHPIYSGFLLGMLGTALALGQVRGIAGLILASMGWHMKSRVEEAYMIEQFGAAYVAYRREVKALIPFVL
jgi:protein-S-isoprenylcysteine O-methyltransferase Ste14